MSSMDSIPAAQRPFFYIYGRVVPKTEKWLLTRNGFDPVKRHQLHAKHAQKEKPILDVKEVMTANDPRYDYNVLGSRDFRMLQIHAAPSRTDPINCSLLTWSIDDIKAPFEALSYTWGDAKERHWITIDGKAIDVTPNLLGALQQFRLPDHDRLIWVDAVCINQQDIAERGAQVLFMDLIYQRATTVLVWLGVTYSQSHLAFELMNQISAVMDVDRQAHAEGNAGEMYKKYIMHQDIVDRGLPSQDDPAWLALDALFWRQWFLRVWVVQEVCVPRTAVVVCGSDTMDFDAFCDLCDYLNVTNLGSMTGLSADRVLSLRTARNQYQTNDRASLVTQLISSRTCLATNAVDKVFALLNISKDVPPDNDLRPDYHKSPTTVFSDTARILLAHSLDILNFNSDRVWRVQTDLPSWAPDWSCAPREFSLLFSPQGPWLHAGKASLTDASLPDVQFSENKKLLYVKGRILDKITNVGESYFIFSAARLGKVHNDWYAKNFDKDEVLYRFSRHRRWTMWERMALKLKTYPATGEDVRTVFQKTMTADAPFPQPTNLETLYTAFRKIQSTDPWSGQENMTEEELRIQKDHHDLFNQQVRTAAYGRKLFTTKKGYIGLAPVSAATGCYVAILHGGRTAYVLRKKKNGNYALVGEAYLHGFMHGEGLNDSNPVEELILE